VKRKIGKDPFSQLLRGKVSKSIAYVVKQKRMEWHKRVKVILDP
jgi:hypothetical protein